MYVVFVGLFGEGPVERRNRLRAMVASLGN